MTETLYCDTANVVEAIKRAVRHTDVGDDAMHVSVHDCEAVMRGITLDEIQERNLDGHLGDHICTFEYDGTRLELTFHQNQLEGEFRLSPARHDAIPPVEQASDVKELAPTVGHVLHSLEREWDITCYDFMEVSAGSIGNGHFTDFEFEYAVTSTDI